MALKREVEHIQNTGRDPLGSRVFVQSASAGDGGRVCLCERKCVCIQSVRGSLSICMCGRMLACGEYMQVCNCVYGANLNQSH